MNIRDKTNKTKLIKFNVFLFMNSKYKNILKNVPDVARKFTHKSIKRIYEC